MKDMTVGSPTRFILLFTLPLILGNILQQMYSFIDTLIVGRTLGVNALAAVGSTGSLMFLMIGIVMGLTGGFAIVAGQHYGAGNLETVRRSIACGLLLSAIFAILLTALSMMIARPLLEWMQTPPDILDNGAEFLMIICAGTGAFMLLNYLSNLNRALGNSKTPLFFLLLSTILNVIFELVFLLQLDRGVRGAAEATILSVALTATLYLIYLFRQNNLCHITRHDWYATCSFYLLHLRAGLGMAFQSSTVALGAIILQTSLNQFGATAIAAYSAAQKIDAIANMPMMSFGMTMAAYTAQNFGAGKLSRIQDGVCSCMKMSVSFAIVMGLINMTCGPFLISLFVGSDEAEVIELAQVYLSRTGLAYFVLSLLFIYRYTLQGLGQNSMPTLSGFIELTARIFAAVVLASVFGYSGLCLSAPLSWTCAALPLGIAYYRTIHRLTANSTSR